MEIQPRLSTITMIREAMKEKNSQCSRYQLWKLLPRKTMYQAYTASLAHLEQNNEITTDHHKKLVYFEKHKEQGAIAWEMIIDNLDRYGYDLIMLKEIKKRKKIALEDLIIEILLRYPEARFIEAIPLLLLKNKIDTFELYRKAYNYRLINKIGFLLEMSCNISKKIKKKFPWKELLQEFQSKKENEISYFTTIKDKKFLEKTTPATMKKWNLRGRFLFNDFYKEEYL